MCGKHARRVNPSCNALAVEVAAFRFELLGDHSRMVGNSETIPTPCGSTSESGGHLAV
jgi:hypothetical protein